MLLKAVVDMVRENQQTSIAPINKIVTTSSIPHLAPWSKTLSSGSRGVLLVKWCVCSPEWGRGEMFFKKTEEYSNRKLLFLPLLCRGGKKQRSPVLRPPAFISFVCSHCNQVQSCKKQNPGKWLPSLSPVERSKGWRVFLRQLPLML